MSFIAPMKLKPTKRIVTRNERWLIAVGLTFLTLVWFGFVLSAAQNRNGKRIQSMRVSDSAEGARVTIVADLPLNDYEAFSRGDRFCVKIPAAEYVSALHRLRGNGFEYVQIQKSGDSVIISFTFHPGASAKVEQPSNRLDVVFSPSVPSTRNNNAATQTAVNPSLHNPGRRTEDTAGAIPPGSPRSVRDARSSERSGVTGTPAGAAADQRTAGPATPGGTGNTATNAQPGSAASPNSVSEVASTSGTPLVSGSTSGSSTTAQPSASSSPSSTQGFSSRSQTGSSSSPDTLTSFSQWLALNRPLALAGLLSVLGLLLLLGAWIRRRRRTISYTLHVPLTSQESATPETLEKPSAPESISHPREAKELIMEPPFSETPGQLERTDIEVEEILGGGEYDDETAFRVVEEPVESNQGMAADEAFAQFLDTLNRLDLIPENLAQAAPESSAVLP